MKLMMSQAASLTFRVGVDRERGGGAQRIQRIGQVRADRREGNETQVVGLVILEELRGKLEDQCWPNKERRAAIRQQLHGVVEVQVDIVFAGQVALLVPFGRLINGGLDLGELHGFSPLSAA